MNNFMDKDFLLDTETAKGFFTIIVKIHLYVIITVI